MTTTAAPSRHHTGARVRLLPQRRLARWAFAVLALVLVSGAASVWLWSRGLLPLGSDVVDVARFAATKEFAALPPQKQEPYVTLLIDNRWQLALAYKTGQLTRAEMNAAAHNCWTIASAKYLEAYSVLESPADKQAYLDQLIDEMERYRLLKWAAGAGLRADASQRRDAPSGGPPGSRVRSPRQRDVASPWLTPGRIKKLIETMPPVQRARVSEFYAELLQRRAERGLSGPAAGD